MSYATALPIGWADFKNVAISRDISIQYLETSTNYYLLAIDWHFSVRCDFQKTDPPSADQLDFETNFKATCNGEQRNLVTTQEEKNDKTLKLAKASANFDATTNLAICELIIPGTFNGFGYASNGRFIAGGYAFTDAGAFGDAITLVELIDINGVTGNPAGTVIKTYHDQDVDPLNSGWYLWGAPNGQQEIEIDPIGGYGKMFSGMKLRITFQKIPSSAATGVKVNIWWGKIE
jgi:hypothetical protein